MIAETAAHPADPQGSLALREAQGRRADLHAVIVELERSAAVPAPGRHAWWCEQVHDAVVEVTAAFERHCAATEGPGGLFQEIVHDAPRLAGGVDRLRDEHDEIREMLGAALVELRRLHHAHDEQATAEGRQIVMELLDHLIRHRQSGADLVYEAYAVDVGGGD